MGLKSLVCNYLIFSAFVTPLNILELNQKSTIQIMNNIAENQNYQKNLELLAAQRQLYSDAKTLQTIRLMIGVLAPIISSMIIINFPRYAAYIYLLLIVMTLLEVLLLAPLQKCKKENAAKIQQLFDCRVLEFNRAYLNLEIEIEDEIIINAYKKYKRKFQNYSQLENWYPISVKELPIDKARIVCQRTNIRWDNQLRKRYSYFIIFILVTLTIILFVVSFMQEITVKKFVLDIILPLQPAFIVGGSQFTENNQTITRLNKLKNNIQFLLKELINQQSRDLDLETKANCLQSQIYDYRRCNTLIFDFFYFYFQSQDEEEMIDGAESLIEKLKANPG